MAKIKPMKIVLIEDDVADCKAFIECANNRTDVLFVGITGSSDEGLRYVNTRRPEAIILDLELNWGQGSGYDFLDEIQKFDLDIRPIIAVTTQNRNLDRHAQMHAQYAVDFLFCKFKEDYSPDIVINHLLKFRSFASNRSVNNPSLQSLETPEELQNRIKQRIKAELDIFGVNVRYKGRSIGEDAIYILLNKNEKDTETVFQELARTRGTSYNNIVRPLKTAIDDAWDNHDDPDALLKAYTAPVRLANGGPTPTEFTHYYARKIRKDME